MRPALISAVIEQEFSSTQQGYHTPVMIWGPPGVGKSQIVAQVAESHKVAIVDIRLSQMEPSDLRGIPFKNGEKVEWAIQEWRKSRMGHSRDAARRRSSRRGRPVVYR